VSASTLTVVAGTFTGNLISIPVSYSALASPAISPGPAEVAQGSNVYVNLANLYLTFSSSIC
jgi:hypothetical protein